MGKSRTISSYGFVILFTIMLFSQFLEPVEAAGSDARTKAEAVSAQSKAQKDALATKVDDAKAAWKTAKAATETAKQTYKNNKTDDNKTAVATAKTAEKTAYDAYKTALQNWKNFKFNKDPDVVEKSTKSVGETKTKVKSDARISAEAVSAQSKTQKDALATKVDDAKAAWKTAKAATETAKQTYNSNKTDDNKTAVATAKTAEKTAYDAYKTALKNWKNFKFNKDPDVVEKSTKSVGETKTKVKSDARISAEAVSEKVKAAKDALATKVDDAKAAWKTAKAATETAKQTYNSNKTDDNKTAVINAKTAEKTAYDAYKTALKNWKNFKNISLDE